MLMTQAYSSKFRTVDMFSQFQAHSSGITQEQFMHILNLLGRLIQIHAYLELLFTSARNVLRTFRHIDKGLHIEKYLPTFRDISANSRIFGILTLPVQIMYTKTSSSSQVLLLNHC